MRYRYDFKEMVEANGTDHWLTARMELEYTRGFMAARDYPGENPSIGPVRVISHSFDPPCPIMESVFEANPNALFDICEQYVEVMQDVLLREYRVDHDLLG